MKKLDYAVYPFSEDNKSIRIDKDSMSIVSSTVHLEYLLNLKELHNCTL